MKSKKWVDSDDDDHHNLHDESSDSDPWADENNHNDFFNTEFEPEKFSIEEAFLSRNHSLNIGSEDPSKKSNSIASSSITSNQGSQNETQDSGSLTSSSTMKNNFPKIKKSKKKTHESKDESLEKIRFQLRKGIKSLSNLPNDTSLDLPIEEEIKTEIKKEPITPEPIQEISSIKHELSSNNQELFSNIQDYNENSSKKNENFKEVEDNDINLDDILNGALDDVYPEDLTEKQSKNQESDPAEISFISHKSIDFNDSIENIYKSSKKLHTQKEIEDLQSNKHEYKSVENKISKEGFEKLKSYSSNICKFFGSKGISLYNPFPTLESDNKLSFEHSLLSFFSQLDDSLLYLDAISSSTNETSIALNDSLNRSKAEINSLHGKNEQLEYQLKQSIKKEQAHLNNLEMMEIQLNQAQSQLRQLGLTTSPVGSKNTNASLIGLDSSTLSIMTPQSQNSSMISKNSIGTISSNNLIAVDVETKKKIRSLEELVKANERKARIKENECEKMKEKLKAFALKEKAHFQRQKELAAMIEKGDFTNIESLISSTKPSNISNSSINCIQKEDSAYLKLNSNPSPPSLIGGQVKNTIDKVGNVVNVFEALLFKINELQEEIQQLKNNITINTTNNIFEKVTSNISNSSSEIISPQSEQKTINGTSIPIPTMPQTSNLHFTEVERELRNHITSLTHSLNLLTNHSDDLLTQLTMSRSTSTQLQHDLHLSRTQLISQQQEIDVLKDQISKSPSVAEYSRAQREIARLEEKIQELTLANEYSSNLNKWDSKSGKNNQSTREKIKNDRRNHELGLFEIFETLPQNQMKQILMMVCRELDVNDLAFIQPAILKYKSVIRAVPRMERFILSITNYVIDRTISLYEKLGQKPPASLLALNTDNKFFESMEKIAPLLQRYVYFIYYIYYLFHLFINFIFRWWTLVLRSVDLEEFKEIVTKEIFRFNSLQEIERLSKDKEMSQNDRKKFRDYMDQLFSHLRAGLKDDPLTIHQKISKAWEVTEKDHWMSKDGLEIVDIIRDLSNFHLQIFHQEECIKDADQFVSSRPDILTNNIVSIIISILFFHS